MPDFFSHLLPFIFTILFVMLIMDLGHPRSSPITTACASTPSSTTSSSSTYVSEKDYTPEKKRAVRDRIVRLFRHGYDSYMKHAFPLDELKPLTCQGTDHFGGYSLTLIDSLDMLALVGDDFEFMKQVHYIAGNVNFVKEKRVSVFETTIRVVGGLVSGHQLAVKMMDRIKATGVVPPIPDGERNPFHYDNELLDSAVAIADRLLPAFDTPTGIPYNEVCLKNGVDPSKGHTTCPAAAGSLLLEFGALSAMTGNCTYVTLARRALEGIWKYRSPHNLVGTMIDVLSGRWVNIESSIGASIDSFYEYIYKAYVLFDDDRYLEMWNTAYKAVQKYTYHSGWYVSSSVEFMGPLQHSEHRINSLMAFWPGLQVLAGDVHAAMQSYEKFYCIVRDLAFMPEYTHLNSYLAKQAHVKRNGPGYPLRPEFLESTYYLYHATKDKYFLSVAEEFLDNLERTKMPCGFAAVVDVFDFKFEDKMDSFVLAETFKYLYMIFSPTKEDIVSMKRDGILEHLHGDPSQPHSLLYDLQEDFVVNTEAHPLSISTSQRNVYHQCLASQKDVSLSSNLDHIISDDFLAHPVNDYEKFDPTRHTPLEKSAQCPVMDYMLDVAPMVEDLMDKARCYDRVNMHVLGTAKDASKEDLTIKGDMATRGRVGNAKDLQVFEMPIYIPRDPVDNFSKPFSLTLRYSSPKKLETITYRGVVAIPQFADPNVLFMEAHRASLFVWNDVEQTIMTGGAAFGPQLCDDPQLTRDRPYVGGDEQDTIGKEAIVKVPLVHLDGNGCYDGTSGPNTLNAEILEKSKLTNADGSIDHSNRFVAIMKRGGCTFKEKILTAQHVGAIAAVVYNNNEDEEAPTSMADAPLNDHPKYSAMDVKIPAYMISFKEAQHLLKKTKTSGDEEESRPSVISHMTELWPISVVCAYTPQQQYLSFGLKLQTLPQEHLISTPHLLIYRPRQHMIVNILVSRMQIQERERQEAANPVDLPQDEQDIAAFFKPNVEHTNQVLKKWWCQKCRLFVQVGTTLSNLPGGHANNGGQGGEGGLYSLTGQGRIIGDFLSSPRDASKELNLGSLRFVFDQDPASLPPDVERTTQEMIMAALTTGSAAREAGTDEDGKPNTKVRSALAKQGTVLSFIGHQLPSMWQIADVRFYNIARWDGSYKTFVTMQSHMLEDISNNFERYGIAAYFFGIDAKTGACFEVFVTTSAENREVLFRPDFEQHKEFYQFHAIKQMRESLIDLKNRVPERDSTQPLVAVQDSPEDERRRLINAQSRAQFPVQEGMDLGRG